MDIYDRCLGCEERRAPNQIVMENHIHNYRTPSGRSVTCWWIENLCYTALDDVIDFVKNWKSVGLNDALNILGDLPRHHNQP